ncbi:MAG: ATP-binding protein [Campylobacterota bacterium]|nr:ATP-binding protein [Campylobacterota bacterium]
MNLKELIVHTKKLNVLYAEDDILLCKTTKELFNGFFNHVEAVKDGLEALEQYKRYHEETSLYYDIVITDLLMPRVDGYELSKHLFNFNPTQEIIIISAHADFHDVIALMNLGVNKFIEKPVKIEALSPILYDISLNIRKSKMEKTELEELNQHNIILQERSDDKIKALQEFSNALNLSAIVAKTDIRGTITYVNNQFCDISGYTQEELIGHNNNILKSGSRSSSYYKKLWNTINDKKTYKTIFENRAKDGSFYYIETTINPIVDLNGDIIEFIAVSHDMTTLMNSIERARKAEKAKDDFFINISHEMKTPLNSILGFSSLLKKRIKDDDKLLMMVDTIAQTGEELKNLVNSILDISKIKSKSLVLENRIFHPTIELEKCFEKYQLKAIEKNQEFKVTIDDKLPSTLLGDNTRIIQMIAIILDNAIKFTPKNGKIHSNIGYDTFSHTFICEIKDNGIGIAKEHQQQIFGLEQLDASSNRSYEGSGIGLNIASSLLKLMDGKISLKSIPNRGSLFTIEIPLQEN